LLMIKRLEKDLECGFRNPKFIQHSIGNSQLAHNSKLIGSFIFFGFYQVHVFEMA